MSSTPSHQSTTAKVITSVGALAFVLVGVAELMTADEVQSCRRHDAPATLWALVACSGVTGVALIGVGLVCLFGVIRRRPSQAPWRVGLAFVASVLAPLPADVQFGSGRAQSGDFCYDAFDFAFEHTGAFFAWRLGALFVVGLAFWMWHERRRSR